MPRKTKNAVTSLIDAASDASVAIAGDMTTPATKTLKRRTTIPKSNKPSALKLSVSAASIRAASEKPIAGKLGAIATAVSTPRGATIGELTETTGWQPHTVRAALTRLRQRGIDAKLTTIDDRRVYRVAGGAA